MTSLFKIAESGLTSVPRRVLAKEELLEDWVVANPRLLGLDLLILGRQIIMDNGKRLDILAMDGEGGLVVIELKRDRTSRDVVAQALEYASWVRKLSDKQIYEITAMKLGRPLAEAFQETFETPLPDKLNRKHSMMIVASELDDSSRRIVEYLSDEHQVAINTCFFSVFEQDGQQYLATDWLMDQEDVVERADAKNKAPWTGYSYVNVGQGEHRTWADCLQYGFLSAGQGPRWSKALKRLSIGDKVFAYLKGAGYIGFGEITASAVMVSEFLVDGTPLLSLSLNAKAMGENVGDPELCEWVVGVKWLKTFAEGQTFPGAFASTHVVCKLSDPATLSFLHQLFGG